jgi:hypothetical protein
MGAKISFAAVIFPFIEPARIQKTACLRAVFRSETRTNSPKNVQKWAEIRLPTARNRPDIGLSNARTTEIVKLSRE